MDDLLVDLFIIDHCFSFLDLEFSGYNFDFDCAVGHYLFLAILFLVLVGHCLILLFSGSEVVFICIFLN